MYPVGLSLFVWSLQMHYKIAAKSYELLIKLKVKYKSSLLILITKLSYINIKQNLSYLKFSCKKKPFQKFLWQTKIK